MQPKSLVDFHTDTPDGETLVAGEAGVHALDAFEGDALAAFAAPPSARRAAAAAAAALRRAARLAGGGDGVRADPAAPAAVLGAARVPAPGATVASPRSAWSRPRVPTRSGLPKRALVAADRAADAHLALLEFSDGWHLRPAGRCNKPQKDGATA